MTAAKRESIYKHLTSTNSPGQWALIQREMRIAEHAAAMKEDILAEATKIIESKISNRVRDASSETSPPEKDGSHECH